MLGCNHQPGPIVLPVEVVSCSARNHSAAAVRLQRGLWNPQRDRRLAKKLLTINGCPLCSLTHSLAGERGEWKSCKESIGVPIDYVHRDELTPRLKNVSRELPCAVAEVDGELTVVLTAEVIARCKGSIADLRGRLNTHAAMLGLSFPVLESA